ncbi:MAG: hypothetical protein LLF76_07800 [Planctomycetaceae bacterium]|nr:hypothetical protein [Planctomycetaceae bacterium]
MYSSSYQWNAGFQPALGMELRMNTNKHEFRKHSAGKPCPEPVEGMPALP